MTIAFTPLHRLPTTPLELDGQNLTIDDVVSVARGRRRVTIGAAARTRVRRCRVMVDVLLEQGHKVYGLTTGFGQLRDVPIDARDAEQLQLNLIRSHAAGVGEPFAEDVVRAAMLLRLNTLCRGNSGIREQTLDRLLAMLDDDVYAFVPQQGSVGACGDLAPLSHLVLALLGDPAGRYLPRRLRRDHGPVTDARADEFVGFPAAGDAWAGVATTEGWRTFTPARLAAKEGLALNNGTTFMTAVTALAVHDAHTALRAAEAATALSLEAHQGQPASLDPRIQQARGQDGQAEVAARLRALIADSQLLGVELNVGHLGTALRELDQLATALAGDPRHGAVAALRNRARDLVPHADGRVDPIAVAALRARPAREQIAALAPTAAAVAADVEAFAATAGERLAAPARRAAAALRRVVAESPHVQDDYSLRCMPVVVASAWRALAHTATVVTAELNAATDNPLLFPPEPPVPAPADYRAWLLADPARVQDCLRGVVGGANFHGHPIAGVADYLAIALAAVGNIGERRIAHLVDANHSRGLPGFLTAAGGLTSGLMLAQYTAAALVAENKVLCHPASVDSVPTCANTEDYVSMGTLAARKAATVLRHVEQITAIELALTARALQFRVLLRPGPRGRELAALVAARCLGDAALDQDVPTYAILERARHLLRMPEFLDLLG